MKAHVSLITQIGALLAVCGGFVALLLRHQDPSTYVSTVTPIIAGFGLWSRLDARSDKQDASLATITSQTNGVLTARIKAAVKDALNELDGTPDTPVAAPVAPAPAAPDAPAPTAAPSEDVADVEELATALAHLLKGKAPF